MLERCFRLRSLVLILLGLVLTTPDASAAPQTNSPPNTPITLGPPDQGVDVPIDFELGWYCSDPDGDPLLFDVYFGVAPNVQLVAANVTGPVYDPGPGAYDTIYNWYVVARDSHGAETQGPTWTFTTRPENFVPTVPSDPSPPDNATIQPISPALHWESYDNDGEAVLFDVFLGTSDPPALVASDFAAHTYNASGLSYDTQYYWKIIAHDPHGAVSTGPTWTFRTRLSNYPPAVPSSPSPSDNAANVFVPNLQRTLSWQSSDPDNDVLRYDVYFGTATPPPLVVSNQLSSSYTAHGLAFVTAYYWRIVVWDAKGVEVSGPEWTFTTEANDPPNVAGNPSPANNALNQALPVQLTWSASDPESWQSLSYELFFGTDAAPPLVATGLTDRFYNASPLVPGATYYWRIVVRDQFGLTTSGPLWTFTTRVDLPPTVPANPSPTDGVQLSESPLVVLSWTSTDPENKPLSYKIYFGISPNPGLLTTVSTPQYNLGVIGANLLFYWYIVVSDAQSSVTGPVWTFRSGPGNVPPNAPANPSPADNATDVATNPTLSWEGTDPNGDGLFYDVYFGSTSPPPLHASNVSVSSYGLSQLSVSTDYYWQIAARDGSGLVTTGGIWKFRTAAIATGAGAIPLELALGQNHPNPFNPQTTIRYDLPPGTTHVRLWILDVAGHIVRTLVDESQTGGTRSVVWNGSDDRGESVSSGVYFYVLDTGGKRLAKKLVLLK